MARRRATKENGARVSDGFPPHHIFRMRRKGLLYNQPMDRVSTKAWGLYPELCRVALSILPPASLSIISTLQKAIYDKTKTTKA